MAGERPQSLHNVRDPFEALVLRVPRKPCLRDDAPGTVAGAAAPLPRFGHAHRDASLELAGSRGTPTCSMPGIRPMLARQAAPRCVLVVSDNAAVGLILGLAMHPPGYESKDRAAGSEHSETLR